MNRIEQDFFDQRNGQPRISKRELIISVVNYLMQFNNYITACDIRDKIKRIDPAREIEDIPIPEKLTEERFQQVQQASFIFADCEQEENKQFFYFLLRGAWLATHDSGDGVNFEALKDEFFELCPDACKQVEITLKNPMKCN